MPSAVFAAFGLTIKSAAPIPGALPLTDTGAPDIEVVFGDAALPRSPDLVDPPYALAGPHLLFSMESCAHYRCDEGGRIIIAPHGEACTPRIADMLVATALPALLWTRRYPILHAATAVSPCGSRGVAVAGPSGSGKSTVLAGLVDAGWSVVSDDTTRLERIGGDVYGSGLPTRIYQRQGQRSPELNAGPAESARRALAVPLHQTSLRARIGTVFVLAPHRCEPPSFQRHRDGSALLTLLSQRHRPRIPRLLGIEAKMLPIFGELTERLAVYTWHRQAGSTPLTPFEYAQLLTAA